MWERRGQRNERAGAFASRPVPAHTSNGWRHSMKVDAPSSDAAARGSSRMR